MPNDKYDSGHPIIPVLHPSGEIHNIEVPFDTDLNALHSAFVDANYHFSSPPGPTREGVLENTPAFRTASQKAWEKAGYGNRAEEAGFVVDKTGTPGQVREERDTSGKGGEMKFQTSPGEMVVHTHSDPYVRQLSSGDIESAKKAKTNIYAITKDGLWLVEPSGKVTQVYKKDDWMIRKNPE